MRKCHPQVVLRPFNAQLGFYALLGVVVGKHDLAIGALPVGQQRRGIDAEIIVQVVKCLCEIVGGSMSHRPLQEQRQGCGHVGRTRDGGREGIDDLEEVARCRLVKRLRTASDVNGTHRFLGEIECFNSLVNNGIAGHAAPIGHVGKREEWLQVALHTAILHLTPIVVGILRRHNIVVNHYPLVVFLHIDITQLAHLAQLRLAPSLLDAEMLV